MLGGHIIVSCQSVEIFRKIFIFFIFFYGIIYVHQRLVMKYVCTICFKYCVRIYVHHVLKLRTSMYRVKKIFVQPWMFIDI